MSVPCYLLSPDPPTVPSESAPEWKQLFGLCVGRLGPNVTKHVAHTHWLKFRCLPFAAGLDASVGDNEWVEGRAASRAGVLCLLVTLF